MRVTLTIDLADCADVAMQGEILGWLHCMARNAFIVTEADDEETEGWRSLPSSSVTRLTPTTLGVGTGYAGVDGWPMRAREILPLPEIGAVQPQKPLTPAQARKRADKQVRVQQQLRNEGTRHAAKVRDLTSRLPN